MIDCIQAQHLRNCGECADEIERIVRSVLVMADMEREQAAKEPAEVEMVSHADIPNAQDHPADHADRCGICIRMKREKMSPQQRPTTPAAVLSQFETL